MKRRKNTLRFEGYNYSNSGAYFITICSYKKENIFGDIENGLMHLNNIGKIIQDCWYQITENNNNVKLDDFVIMPNHIHGIIRIVGAIHESPEENINARRNNGVIRELPLRNERRTMLLSKIIGRFKMNTSKLINKIHNSKGSHNWQRSYYDHIIRCEEDLNNTKQYIQNNPFNWETDEYGHFR